MATRKQTVDGLSEAAEVNPVTTEASAQNLGADLLPRVSRGQRSPQYGAEQIAAVLTSLASPSPIRAGIAVRTFWDLKSAGDNSFDVGESFKDWIVSKIDESRTPEALAKLKREASADDRLQAWFCLSPPSISVHTVRRGGYLNHGVMFLPEIRTRENMRRRGVETVVKLDLTILLQAAGKLLADTLTREPAATLLPPEASPARDAEGEKTTSKTTKAAEPASSNGLQSAQPETSAYPAPAQTKPSDKAKSNHGKESKQLAFEPRGRASQVRVQPEPVRNRHNGENRTTAHPR